MARQGTKCLAEQRPNKYHVSARKVCSRPVPPPCSPLKVHLSYVQRTAVALLCLTLRRCKVARRRGHSAFAYAYTPSHSFASLNRGSAASRLSLSLIPLQASAHDVVAATLALEGALQGLG